jgi:hypothetical protein
MVTDRPYGMNSNRIRMARQGRAEWPRRRTELHEKPDQGPDWSEAFELVPTLQTAYVWHASKFTSEVLAGLLRIGFIHHQQ